MPVLAPGTSLGPYRIDAPLGAGGMGEVYRARDTRMERDVAVKILPPGRDLSRFRTEIKTLAALSHSNLLAIYDVNVGHEPPYFVCELVEGEALTKLLARGPLTLHRAVELGGEIADGLAAAHSAGVIHRDLKPDNIMVARDGHVKILDFGLAKAAVGEGDATLTQEGLIMGTLGYMSPEQARGAAADSRSDLFSFGAVLYEMVSGARAFHRTTAADTLSAILKEDPPDLNEAMPAGRLLSIVRRCLEKDPSRRFQSAADLGFALRQSVSPLTAAGMAAAMPASVGRRWLVPAAAMTIALGGALLWLGSRHAAPPEPLRFTPVAIESYNETSPVWSPDGRSIAYLGRGDLMLRTLAMATAARLAPCRVCSDLRFSGDGARLFYVSAGALWSVPVTGGEPRQVSAGAGLRGAAVSPDGATALFVKEGALMFGAPGSKDLTMYARPSFTARPFAGNLRFSPDGKSVAAALNTTTSGNATELWLIPVPFNQGTPSRLESAKPLITGHDWFPDSQRLAVSLLGQDGVNRIFALYIATASLEPLVSGIDGYLNPAVSPDGRSLAFSRRSVDDSDLIEISLESGRVTPVLASVIGERQPAWFPDGKSFAYLWGSRFGQNEIRQRNLDASLNRQLAGDEQSGVPAGSGVHEPAISPDGQRLLFTTRGDVHTSWVVNTNGGRAVRLDPDSTDEHFPTWSPDGKWIALRRAQPKREIVKMPSGGGPVSLVGETPGNSGAGGSLSWSPAGNWLLLESPTLKLFPPEGGTAREIAPRPYEGAGFSADGKQIYGIRRSASRNWVLERFDTATGAPQRSVEIDIDPEYALEGFSMHPDGRRILTALLKPTADIYRADGLPQPLPWWRFWR